MTSTKQLSRTVLLFQTDLAIEDPVIIYRAITTPRISLIADSSVVNTLSGQVAISTAAMLMARSGHRVFIDTPDVPLKGYQPPMIGRTFHEAINSVSDNMIDRVSISVGCPLSPPDIAFVFGNCGTVLGIPAKRIVSVGWSDWSAEIAAWPVQARCNPGEWPIGAMGSSVLVASEAAKLAGLSLARLAGPTGHFHELFAPAQAVRFDLAPSLTPCCSDFGEFDIISAGAVSNAFLYALLRLPGANGSARTFDKDTSDQSNRNRNILLLPEFVERPKVELFQHFGRRFSIIPVYRNFSEKDLADLSDRIAIGVDDIPTRWILAKRRSRWMGVGATSHFNSMASVHYPYGACAACLHPQNEELGGPTPTIAFVSFLSGLMMAADFLVDVTQKNASIISRYRYVNALQMGNPWESVVVPLESCPAGCPASRSQVA